MINLHLLYMYICRLSYKNFKKKVAQVMTQQTTSLVSLVLDSIRHSWLEMRWKSTANLIKMVLKGIAGNQMGKWPRSLVRIKIGVP